MKPRKDEPYELETSFIPDERCKNISQKFNVHFVRSIKLIFQKISRQRRAG